MLLEFSVSNFRSIKDKVTLSMVASDLTELSETNILQDSEDVLSVAGIFGPNSSGKSNIIKAISFMIFFVLNSFGSNSFESNIPIESFVFSTEITPNSPSEFDIVFSNDSNDIYEYGFTLNHSEILSETLTVNEETVFTRENQKIHSDENKISDHLMKERMTKSNVLYLSILAATNTEVATDIVSFFKDKISIINGASSDISWETKNMIDQDEYKSKIVEAIHGADLYIDDLSLEKADFNVKNFTGAETIPQEILDQVAKNALKVKSSHRVYDINGKETGSYSGDISSLESKGTQSFLAVIGPVIKALSEGTIIFIDEMGATLHPLMSEHLVKMFMLPDNKKNGQLVFNANDSNLLNNKLLRRDQIWFTDKDSSECTSLVPLDSYVHNGKRIRSDVNYAKRYLSGDFGAIPIFKN
ncbi:ATP-binding protein [Companilactobacillus allii]|uniref:ATPase AAA-type core domain-containing protein n=1 Tax=Companilactobacillus allii TaxID=1847728 RepID=A0A1P8Q285_9LACO|nr:ATP-binding protein [Companilactobacillus allii]APX71968.1 hypothetical protein BTM29_05085 [Companilactobacillus allii]USQ69063.1 ATP-binding protein [Companilactobacillus allii]